MSFDYCFPDGFDQIITNVKIQSNLKVGDLVHTVVLKDENVPIEDIHLVEGNGYFQLNPSNRSKLASVSFDYKHFIFYMMLLR